MSQASLSPCHWLSAAANELGRCRVVLCGACCADTDFTKGRWDGNCSITSLAHLSVRLEHVHQLLLIDRGWQAAHKDGPDLQACAAAQRRAVSHWTAHDCVELGRHKAQSVDCQHARAPAQHTWLVSSVRLGSAQVALTGRPPILPGQSAAAQRKAVRVVASRQAAATTTANWARCRNCCTGVVGTRGGSGSQADTHVLSAVSNFLRASSAQA